MRNQKTLWRLMMAIMNNEGALVEQLLASEPSLAAEHLIMGATRQRAKDFFFKEIVHYLYSGDSALHAAAAGNRQIRQALEAGGHVADISAQTLSAYRANREVQQARSAALETAKQVGMILLHRRLEAYGASRNNHSFD